MRESAQTSFPMATQTSWFIPDVLGGTNSVSEEPVQGGSGSGNRDDAMTVGTGVQFRLGPRGPGQVGHVSQRDEQCTDLTHISEGFDRQAVTCYYRGSRW